MSSQALSRVDAGYWIHSYGSFKGCAIATHSREPYAFVKQQMREKKHERSFVSQAIQEVRSDPVMEQIHKWFAASMYTGGADTTISSRMTFFLAMTLFPEVQTTAQEELDSVIGHRLPISSDRESLPYV